MSAIYLDENRLLVKDGAIAVNADCCCSDCDPDKIVLPVYVYATGGLRYSPVKYKPQYLTVVNPAQVNCDFSQFGYPDSLGTQSAACCPLYIGTISDETGYVDAYGWPALGNQGYSSIELQAVDACGKCVFSGNDRQFSTSTVEVRAGMRLTLANCSLSYNEYANFVNPTIAPNYLFCGNYMCMNGPYGPLP